MHDRACMKIRPKYMRVWVPAHRCSDDMELLSSMSVFTLWNVSSPSGAASAALKHSDAFT